MPQQVQPMQIQGAGSENGLQAPLQAIQNGLGVMMQSVSALSNEAAAAARAEMAQQQVQAAEQNDRSALEQLAKRVATLEAGQNSGSHHADAELQSKLQAETAQVQQTVQAQSAAVKDEATKTQDIMTRLTAIEKAQKKKKEEKKQDAQEDAKQASVMRRLDELEKKIKDDEAQKRAQKTDSTNSRMEAALKDVQAQLTSFKDQLAATKKENTDLKAEVEKLKAKSLLPPPPVPPPPPSKDDDDDDDDASLMQVGHRRHHINTYFHRKIRHGKH